MSISQSVYYVRNNNSFVIVRIEGHFINFFAINLMIMTSYNIHFSMLFLAAKQAPSVVIELDTPFCKISCHPFIFFIFRVIEAFCNSKVYLSKPTNSTICFPTASSLNILSTLLLSAVLIPDG